MNRGRRPSLARGGRAGRGGTATYVYALVEADTEPPLASFPEGLPGAGPPRLLAVGERLWLLVADAPLDRYGQKAIDRSLHDLEWVSACAVGHERMVEHLTGRVTVLPMKLFTLFRSDARARAHATGARARWTALLRRVRGRREWGVRISLDEGRARVAARARAKGPTRAVGQGTRFLMARKSEQAEIRRLGERARTAAEGAFAGLSRLAREARRRETPSGELGGRLLLDAVFLVDEGRAERFEQAARRLAERLDGDGYRLVLTGPWPVYSFLDERE
jgi:gas vesicle protein GvpL/GvpF